jgi:hypothetical protein
MGKQRQHSSATCSDNKIFSLTNLFSWMRFLEELLRDLSEVVDESDGGVPL